MILTNLDVICRRWLLEKGLPIHYYMEALFHSSTAVRELSYDTLQIINSSNIPVNSYGAIDLPDDYVDDLAVAIPSGQGLIKLPKQDWITPLRLHDTTSGQFVPYNELSASDDNLNTFYGFGYGWDYYWNVDSYGSPTGRMFGSHGGTLQGYKVVRERRQIQLTEDFADTNVVLLYISDGQRADNASQIDVRAISCIQSYIDWRRSPNAAIKNSQEAATFYNEKRRLKTLMNELTKEDVINTIRNAYTASIKF